MMPYKPKRPCSHPGCPNLTYGRFCEEHEQEENRRYERYERNPATRKRYKGKWPQIRKMYVTAHPYCELCFKRYQKLTPAEHVHHITPLSEGGTHDFDNLMSLCQSCHSHIHAERGDYWSKPVPSDTGRGGLDLYGEPLRERRGGHA